VSKMQSDMMTLQELFETARDNARRMFLEDDDYGVLPMWHAVPPEGPHLLIATPRSDNMEKEN
jgi:hypothetical protein